MVVKLRLQYCQSDNIIVNNNWHLAVCLIKKVPIIQSKRLGKKRTFLHDGSKLANHQTTSWMTNCKLKNYQCVV